jgi:hypothetical protein
MGPVVPFCSQLIISDISSLPPDVRPLGLELPLTDASFGPTMSVKEVLTAAFTDRNP